jgi:hypothetical protein
MHIKNHIQDCQSLWAFNYLPYSGETAGELIEGSHSEQNGAAASTKEQNRGHRHDSLDAIINYWNWTKFHTMCMFLVPISKCGLIHPPAGSLYRSYIKCLDMLKTREKKFIEYSARFNAEQIKGWDGIDETPRKVGKQVISVHQAKFAKSECSSLSY